MLFKCLFIKINKFKSLHCTDTSQVIDIKVPDHLLAGKGIGIEHIFIIGYTCNFMHASVGYFKVDILPENTFPYTPLQYLDVVLK